MKATKLVESRLRIATGTRFKTTQWHLIKKAGHADDREALAALCRAYWWPINAFMRAQGQAAEDAQDLTQGFFASLFERDDFTALDPARGTFRCWLRKSAKNFLMNDLKTRRALKRGGGADHVCIDVPDAEERFLVALKDEALTPDQEFDRTWALTVIGRVMASLAAEYEEEGRAELFQSLRSTLADPEAAASDAELALASGRTPEAVRMERWRRTKEIEKRYGNALRAEIAATVNGHQAVDAELQDLVHSLSL